MFRGGGFMNDSNLEQQNDGAKKNSMSKDTRLQCILPITIKMLTNDYKLEQELPSDQLMIVGRVVDYKDEELQILLQVCDETAIQEIIIGKKSGQPPLYMQQFQYEPNIYVCITFNKRSYANQIKCFGLHLKVINNASEITRHSMEVILRYFQRTQGLLPREPEPQTVKQMPQTGFNQQIQGGQNLTKPPVQQFGGQIAQKNQGGFANYQSGPQINREEFKVKNQKPQEKVLICMKYIAQSNIDHCATLSEIQKELVGQMQPQQIVQIIRHLVGENKIYEGEQDSYTVLD